MFILTPKRYSRAIHLFVPDLSKDNGTTSFKWDATNTDYYGYDLGASNGSLQYGDVAEAAPRQQ